MRSLFGHSFAMKLFKDGPRYRSGGKRIERGLQDIKEGRQLGQEEVESRTSKMDRGNEG